MTDTTTDPALDEWRSYDEFAAGIDTYRLPNVSLAGSGMRLTLDDHTTLTLAFDTDSVQWSATGSIAADGNTDPYDAVAVRDSVVFVNLPLTSRERESLTIVYSTTTHRAVVTHSQIGAEDVEGMPCVHQTFWAGVTDGGAPTGEVPAPSRDLIGKRNLYRYSPEHLYEHVDVSSQR